MAIVSHKDTARTVLEQVKKRLEDPRPIDGAERFMVKGQLEYVISEVDAIEELKKARPKPRATDGAGASTS